MMTTLSDRAQPKASAHDVWRQSQAAMTMAGELADLVFGRRLVALDPLTRGAVLQWADDIVREAVEEFADPAPDTEPYDPRTDALQAWRDRQERDR